MKDILKKVFPRTIPVLTGYLALGFAFGVLLQEKGYGVEWAFIMSVFIYAGSGQFLAVTLLSTGASLFQIALLTFLLNFRHMFYGLSFLDKYKGVKEGVVFPIQDPTDVNEYLKDIAMLCGINKRITFHTSRHTFASTVTLANNISIEVVSKMMGHTNTRMTTHYAKLVDKCIGEQMDTLMNTFGNSNVNSDT